MHYITYFTLTQYNSILLHETVAAHHSSEDCLYMTVTL